VISAAGQRVIAQETSAEAVHAMRRKVAHMHAVSDIGACIASGSFPTAGMIVAPCSIRTLSAISLGLADNLLVRAADVHLKERRRLVLIVRESPLHLGHLRAMTQATEIGAIIAPPVPAFYLPDATVEEMTDQIARRALGLLGLDDPLLAADAWQGWRPSRERAPPYAQPHSEKS
jgi:4-hydroxy-3-polyprenylbenzoate decarboxylase